MYKTAQILQEQEVVVCAAGKLVQETYQTGNRCVRKEKHCEYE
jgi:hypothetical protein